jgi:hypothetical protein
MYGEGLGEFRKISFNACSELRFGAVILGEAISFSTSE